MNRQHIHLADWQVKALNEWRARLGVTKAEIIREAITEKLARLAEQHGPPNDNN